MKIRKLSLVVVSVIVLITSCNTDDRTNQETLTGIWNVRQISGGVAGINDEYEPGTITWSFNNQILIVDNNENQGNTYSGLESGTYNFSTIEIDGVNYIIINNAEYGSYTLSIDSLTINQNQTSSGPGADGFILQFEK
ncbi:hypothetical protein OE09_1560 [Flavobacteriaceae bacterium MAR_2010_72]|nr:hypothetical protein OE09_1560 [Flavobacteriaceae bacterium MAR_2010_72]TVZ59717.1 hypothetical protein NA63_2253 [Flavobacteriaceae bacterium MAR_2010_105]